MLGGLSHHVEGTSDELKRHIFVLTGLPQHLRCDDTQKLLDWHPEVTFADGMKATFEWYHEEYG